MGARRIADAACSQCHVGHNNDYLVPTLCDTMLVGTAGVGRAKSPPWAPAPALHACILKFVTKGNRRPLRYLLTHDKRLEPGELWTVGDARVGATLWSGEMR